MAFVARFAPEGLTSDAYDKIIKRLKEAGLGSPEGRLYHVAFGDPNSLLVSDIWDTHEAMARFREKLEPILKELGVAPSEPQILEVHNVIEGQRTTTAAG